MRRSYGAGACVLCLMTTGVSTTWGQVANLRITEVDPATDRAEVHNTGGAFTTSANRPFCHLFNYMSTVSSGTLFAADERQTFTVNSLNNSASDLWLYTSGPFSNSGNIIHGLQFGGSTSGRTNLATGVGLWEGGSTNFVPLPSGGASIAWDGFGVSPRDWYIDETPTFGSADSTTPGIVASNLNSPMGTDDFENMSLGDEVIAITDWVIVNSSAQEGIFTVRAVNDVLGMVTPRDGSTQWLRIRDQDASNGQNRFYSPNISPASPSNYTWTFFVNIEETPPGAGAANRPRLTIQHDNGGFANAWGIEFSDTGASLVVTGIGGAAASAPIYALGSPTGLGDWVKIELAVDFEANTVSALVNDASAGSLPINLTGDPNLFRFCYRGEGADNVNTMLLDDVRVATSEISAGAVPTTSEWGMLAMVMCMLGTGGLLVRRNAHLTEVRS